MYMAGLVHLSLECYRRLRNSVARTVNMAWPLAQRIGVISTFYKGTRPLLAVWEAIQLPIVVAFMHNLDWNVTEWKMPHSFRPRKTVFVKRICAELHIGKLPSSTGYNILTLMPWKPEKPWENCLIHWLYQQVSTSGLSTTDFWCPVQLTIAMEGSVANTNSLFALPCIQSNNYAILAIMQSHKATHTSLLTFWIIHGPHTQDLQRERIVYTRKYAQNQSHCSFHGAPCYIYTKVAPAFLEHLRVHCTRV